MIPPIEVSTTVQAPPAEAFRIFTQEIDSWWLHGPRFRPDKKRLGVLVLEPHEGGRLLERYVADTGNEANALADEGNAFELGRVRSLQAPTDDSPGVLALDLGGRSFSPGEATHVHISFHRCDGGTRVDVVHGGWELLDANHPALHGLQGAALTSLYGLWWADLLTSLASLGAKTPRERDARPT